MDKINQCFTLSLTSNFNYIFLSRLCNIRLKYPRRLHGLGEEQQKGKRLKMHRLITYPTSSTNCNTEKINEITRSAMFAHSLKDNTTSVTLSIEHQPSSAVVVVINSCVYWNLLTCYWAPIIQWKLCNVVPALFVRKATNCDVTGYKACGSLILKQTSRQNHEVVYRFRLELRHGSSTVFGLQYSGKKLNKNLR